MKRLSLGASRKKSGVELNMSPLIDMVFILLIFFPLCSWYVSLKKKSNNPFLKYI